MYGCVRACVCVRGPFHKKKKIMTLNKTGRPHSVIISSRGRGGVGSLKNYFWFPACRDFLARPIREIQSVFRKLPSLLPRSRRDSRETKEYNNNMVHTKHCTCTYSEVSSCCLMSITFPVFFYIDILIICVYLFFPLT